MESVVARQLGLLRTTGYRSSLFKRWQMWRYVYWDIDRKGGIHLIVSMLGFFFSLVGLVTKSYYWLLPAVFFLLYSGFRIRQQLRTSCGYSIEPRTKDHDFEEQLSGIADAVLVPNERLRAGVVRSREVDRSIRSNRRIEIKIDMLKQSKVLAYLRENPAIPINAIRCKTNDSIYNNKLFYNNKLLQMTSDLQEASEFVRVGPTDYYTFYVTCMFLGFRLSRQNARGFGETLRDVFIRDGNRWELPSLSDQRRAYVIGVSVLAVTSDGYLVMWEQMARAQSSEHMLVPSGSGSVDWNDYRSGDDLHLLIMSAMKREFWEESLKRTGKERQDIDLFEGGMVLGFFRWIMKCGSPEFVGILQLRIPLAEIEADLHEVRESTGRKVGADYQERYRFDSAEGARTTIKRLLVRPDISVPLYVNLLCLSEALEDRDCAPSIGELLGWK